MENAQWSLSRFHYLQPFFWIVHLADAGHVVFFRYAIWSELCMLYGFIKYHKATKQYKISKYEYETSIRIVL